jgi:hypothetical protein
VKLGHHFFQTFAKDSRKLVSSADFLAVPRSVLPRRQIILKKKGIVVFLFHALEESRIQLISQV